MRVKYLFVLLLIVGDSANCMHIPNCVRIFDCNGSEQKYSLINDSDSQETGPIHKAKGLKQKIGERISRKRKKKQKNESHSYDEDKKRKRTIKELLSFSNSNPIARIRTAGKPGEGPLPPGYNNNHNQVRTVKRKLSPLPYETECEIDIPSEPLFPQLLKQYKRDNYDRCCAFIDQAEFVLATYNSKKYLYRSLDSVGSKEKYKIEAEQLMFRDIKLARIIFNMIKMRDKIRESLGSAPATTCLIQSLLTMMSVIREQRERKLFERKEKLFERNENRKRQELWKLKIAEARALSERYNSNKTKLLGELKADKDSIDKFKEYISIISYTICCLLEKNDSEKINDLRFLKQRMGSIKRQLEETNHKQIDLFSYLNF